MGTREMNGFDAKIQKEKGEVTSGPASAQASSEANRTTERAASSSEVGTTVAMVAAKLSLQVRDWGTLACLRSREKRRKTASKNPTWYPPDSVNRIGKPKVGYAYVFFLKEKIVKKVKIYF